MDKKDILNEFSSDPDRYYKVRLFEEQGFLRRSCLKCKRFFWTMDANKDLCPDDADDTYSFIGEPPTNKRFDYTQAWKQVESFFVKNSHTSVNRYPVVCRWRDDLYFTIASVVDFQRVMGSKVIFEVPANPLIVPQTCLRFKDLENVGVTGRHFSSFCMVGQLAIADQQGYWKDQCIDLDFRLLTEQFGIKKEEIVFVEDVWAGGGSFGSSLEYFVRGLELGNAVFTEFQGELGQHTTLDQRIIDMGAGLERFAWITNGTPTAYDCCFGPITPHLFEKAGIDPDAEMLARYFTSIAKNLEAYDDLHAVRRHAVKAASLTDSQVERIITPLEGLYLITDHLRTLIFAITDGALPSNVGGGYNLRMMLRRINATTDKMGINLDIDELIDLHINYLKDTYPELATKSQDVKTILRLESQRYVESKSRMSKMADRLKQREQALSVDQLITLYESDGITPEYLRELNVIEQVPSSFYAKLTELHQSDKKKTQEQIVLDGLPDTETLFYNEDDPMEFEARVLKVFEDSVILDRTAFYARGGGQEPDRGMIAGCNVVDVNKHGNVIVHKIDNAATTTTNLKQGDAVSCTVDAKRRQRITKNHTSTHIINASARRVLGSWIWQHSAFKDEDHARLDITHHSSLTDRQVQDIEAAANGIVAQDIPVTIQYYDRGTAEQKYGFRIYQGGVVPVKAVRIVSIADVDVEACGGTHVSRTKDIELIKITKTKRIQDGVVRIEFVSGQDARQYIKENMMEQTRNEQQMEQQLTKQRLREERKQKIKDSMPALLEKVLAISDTTAATKTTTETINDMEIAIKNDTVLCFTASRQYDEYFHMNFGKKMVKKNPNSAYVGIFESGPTVRVMAHVGGEASKGDGHYNAADIAKAVSEILGGTAGGNALFAQGGGKNVSEMNKAVIKARSMILG